MTLTTRLGGASRSKVAAIGPSSSSRVRGLIVVVAPAGGAVVVPCGRASLGCAVCEMANAMGVSHLDQGRTICARPIRLNAASIGAHALPAKYKGVTVSRGSRAQPRPSASRSARSCAMPRDLSASYSRCAARPSQKAAPIFRTAETAGGGEDQTVRFRSRWIGSNPSVSSQFRNIFHAPAYQGQDPCPILEPCK